MKKEIDKKILIALAAGFGTAIVATVIFLLVENFNKPKAATEKAVEIRVLKAVKDVEKGVNITPEMVSYGSIPATNARIDMIVDADQISGLKTAKEIKTDAILSKSDFVTIAPSSIPEGYVAMSLEVNTISGVTWVLKEGDSVDIVGVLRPTDPNDKRGNISKVQLQAIHVLAVEAPKANKDKSVKTSEKGTITLLLTPEQAQKLMLISSVGEYSVALRGAEDHTEYQMKGVSVTEMIDAPKAPVQKRVIPHKVFVQNQLMVVEVK